MSSLLLSRFTFTFDLVAIKKVSFPACTHVTTSNIQAHVMASAIIDFTFVDVCRRKEEITTWSKEVQGTLIISGTW